MMRGDFDSTDPTEVSGRDDIDDMSSVVSQGFDVSSEVSVGFRTSHIRSRGPAPLDLSRTRPAYSRMTPKEPTQKSPSATSSNQIASDGNTRSGHIPCAVMPDHPTGVRPKPPAQQASKAPAPLSATSGRALTLADLPLQEPRAPKKAHKNPPTTSTKVPPKVIKEEIKKEEVDEDKSADEGTADEAATSNDENTHEDNNAQSSRTKQISRLKEMKQNLLAQANQVSRVDEPGSCHKNSAEKDQG